MLSYAEWVKNITEMTITATEPMLKSRNGRNKWYWQKI